MSLEALCATQRPETPPAAESSSELVRVPTGVPDFDYFMGGIPAGSVVLLIGDAGAGQSEFALTSAVQLMLHAEDPSAHTFHLGAARGPFVYPSAILYVSFTRTRRQVIDEVRAGFDPLYPQVVERHLTFADLSASYFRATSVPAAWSEVPSPFSGLGRDPGRTEDHPLRSLADALDRDGSGRVVIVDSLGDLIVRPGLDPGDLLTFLKGLRRRAKEWGGIVYLLLPRGVADPASEQAMVDSVDGVLSFTWTTNANRSRRQRSLLIDKFLPVLSHVAEEYQGRFVIRVHALTGLVTTQHERI
ncbi:MAG: RAD55 family ATPase [Thermoplasmata archaeon]